MKYHVYLTPIYVYIYFTKINVCLYALTQSGVLDKSKYFMNPFADISLSVCMLICCSSIIGGVSIIKYVINE